MAEADDFYVGYLPQAPLHLARFVRRAVILAAILACVLGLIFASVQRPLGPGIFEFGRVSTFEGYVRTNPVPQLLVVRPGRPGRSLNTPKFSSYILVGVGKWGARELVKDYDGSGVRLRGTLIHRDRRTMIEVVPGTIEPLETTDVIAPEIPVESIERMTLVGEIVDSKCYMGVMKPGSTKVHRACAQRCISGGVPPVLMVRDHLGQAVYFLLTARDGRAMGSEVLPYVGIPIEITGDVEKHGELLVLASALEDWVLR